MTSTMKEVTSKRKHCVFHSDSRKDTVLLSHIVLYYQCLSCMQAAVLCSDISRGSGFESGPECSTQDRHTDIHVQISSWVHPYQRASSS